MVEITLPFDQQNGNPYFFPIFEHIAIGIAYLTIDGHWLAMNQNVCSITGYSREELLLLTTQEMTHSADRASELLFFQSLLNDERSTYSLEKRFICKDQSSIWVNMTVSLLRSAQRHPLFFIVTIEDIQKRKMLEEESRLRLSREMGEHALSERENEQLQILQTLTDISLTHLSLDELFQDILKRIREIMNADNIAVLLLDDTERQLTIRAVQGVEEVIAADVQIPLGKGFAGTIAAQGIPLIVNEHTNIEILNPVLRREIKSLLGVPLLVNERVIGVVHVGMKYHRDFNEQDVYLFQRVAERMALAIERTLLYEDARRAHQDALGHSKQLVQMYEHQSNFVSIVSHEFRTTLTGIQGFSDILRTGEFSQEEVQDFSTNIYHDSLRLVRMINDLLDLEKMKAGSESLSLTSVNLVTLLEEQISRFKVSTTLHVFELLAETDLPPIAGDRDRLIQMIANLLSNAVKYSPGGGLITASVYRNGEMVHLQIRDQGIGIADAALKKIFNMYNRINAESSHHIQGTGLGLAIVHHIAQLHHGQIWVESTLGKGSTFNIVLPVKHFT